MGSLEANIDRGQW